MGALSPFQRPLSDIRAALFVRGLYGLLSLDCWIAMVPHGGRYGVDGFNVAHFAWLDGALPLPTAGFYEALLISCGGLATFCALAPGFWGLRALVAASYTLAWAISMHDSYQHHYLLSWLLLGAAFVGAPSSAEAPLRTGLPPQAEAPVQAHPAHPSPGFALATITCAIVYTFTAIAKFAPDWRDGSVLRWLARGSSTGAPGSLASVRDWAVHSGLSEPDFWRVLALCAALLQVVIACAYLASLGRDAPGSRPLHRVLASCGFLAAAAFHAGAELSGLFAIGWFSAYMLGMACVCLLPLRWLAQSVAVLARVAAHARIVVARLPGWCVVALSLASTGAALQTAAHTHIPGSVAGMALSTACLGLAVWVSRTPASRWRSLGLRGVAVNLSFCACFALFPIAFDYHRRLAGELRKLGWDQAALAAYREAERVAPHGESRQGTIRALEQAVRSQTRAPR